MKPRLIFCIAGCLFVVPLSIADITRIERHLAGMTNSSPTPVLTYSDTALNGSNLSAGTAGGAVSDDLQTIDPTNPIIAFTFGYFFPPESGLVDVIVNFYDDDGVTSPGTGASLLGSIEVGSFGGGTFSVYVDGFDPVPVLDNSIWMEIEFSDSQGAMLITDNPGGAVGTSGNLFAVNGVGTDVLPGGVWSDYYLEVYQAPEPTTLALCVLGAAALRRR